MTQVYFVATPIGNMDEMSYRAVEVLSSVDSIYCEDTRHSMPLLKKYGIDKPCVSYHKFNEKQACDKLLFQLSQGKTVAVISDAGMPCISDPGNILVRQLIKEGYSYTVVSGACALIDAFVLSGFASPFTFVGFLPESNVDRNKLFETLGNTALIFYSSVHNVQSDLMYLHAKLGSRNVCVARELTKMFESVYFGKLGEIEIDTQKGEFVIIVDSVSEVCPLNALTVNEHIDYYVKAGLSKMDAIKAVAKDRNVSKNVIYKSTIE